MEKKEKNSYFTVLWILSIFNILFAFEGSYTILSMMPLIIFSAIVFLLHKGEKINIYKPSKILFILVIEYSIALFINKFRHEVNIYCIAQLLYYFMILLWYLFITQHTFKKKEIAAYCNVLIYFFTILGFYILFQNRILDNTIFSIKTVFGNTIGKNHFSTWIGLAIILSFSFLLYSRKKTKYLISFIILTLSVLFMNSRGAIVSTIISCTIAFIIFLFKNGITMKKIIISFITVIIITIGAKVALDIMPQWLYNRYFVKSYVDDSNMDRVSSWKNALEGISEQPLLGFGPGVFSNIIEYGITDFGKSVKASTPSHNTYIDLTLNGGIVGLIIFLTFMYSIFKVYLKKGQMYIPIIIHVLINSMILGAEKTVYFWTILILLTVISIYMNKYNEENIFLDKNYK